MTKTVNSEQEIVERLQAYALSLNCTEYLHSPKEQREAVASFLALLDQTANRRAREALEKVRNNFIGRNYYTDPVNLIDEMLEALKQKETT